MRGGTSGLMLGYIQEYWYSSLENHKKKKISRWLVSGPILNPAPFDYETFDSDSLLTKRSLLI